MSELIDRFALAVALSVEACAALLIAVGAAQALYRALRPRGLRVADLSERKVIWTSFAVWLLLALEFELAADIVRTAISPSWSALGQLAAIAAIRTFLSYFLERDIEAERTRLSAAAAPGGTRTA